MDKGNLIVVVLLAVACFVLGFWLGRGRQTVRTEVRYETGAAQSGHFATPDLLPERTELPGLVAVPPVPLVAWAEGRADTLWREPDTAAIVRDYAAVRHYSQLLFDDDNGQLLVKAGTQYNRLAYLDYEFTPVRWVESEVRERVWMPFISAGYSTDGSVSVGGGVFCRHVGVEYGYHAPLHSAGGGRHSFSIKYKW